MELYAAESKRLWLQPLSIDDHLSDYHQILRQEETMAWSRGPPHKTIQETLILMEKTCVPPSAKDNERPKVYAILLKPDGKGVMNGEKRVKPRMVGVVGTPRPKELAYKLHSGYWGKGYMSEAVRMFVDLFFRYEEKNADAGFLRAYADPENVASVRVLRKAGFREDI